MNIISEYFKQFDILEQLIMEARNLTARSRSISLLGPLVDKFLQSEEPTRIIEMCVAEFDRDPHVDPPFLGPEHIVLCNDLSGLFIGFGYTKASSNMSLYSSTSEVLLGAASPNGFTYQTSLIPDDWKENIFSNLTKLNEPCRKYCRYGESVFVSTSMVFDYCSNNDLVLKIAAPTTCELMWEFDRVLGTPIRVFASTIEATTISYLIKFLTKYGNEHSSNAIQHLVSHPFHYVRWEVAKALGEIDMPKLIETLNYLVNDKHPKISQAARETLAQIGASNGH
jgi:hypothetical protein